MDHLSIEESMINKVFNIFLLYFEKATKKQIIALLKIVESCSAKNVYKDTVIKIV